MCSSCSWLRHTAGINREGSAQSLPLPADSYRLSPIPALVAAAWWSAVRGKLVLPFSYSGIHCQQRLSHFQLPYNFCAPSSLNYRVFCRFMHLVWLLYQLSTTLANKILNTGKSLNPSLAVC